MARKLKVIGSFCTAICVACALVWWAFFMDKWLITRHIKDWASDPDSVVLRDLRQSKRDKEVWCGEVNARNRMGGMVGFQRFVFAQPGFGDFSSDAELKRILAEMTLETADTFQSKYRLFCE